MTKNAWTQDDHIYMAEALRLAKRGLYTTDPNPRVGCVLVHDGEIVGRGWHQKAGSPHAEVNAIKDAGSKVKGSTAYVTLEPCSHFGRTAPCANALIDSGVLKVVVAAKDPNPQVSGAGLILLSNAGISVSCGLMFDEARDLNIGFFKRMEKQRPWVRIKMAISVDGRTAMQSGESQWITGPHARSDVQRLRARSSAILTGIGTVLHDDAALTVRAEQLGFDADELYSSEEVVKIQPLKVVLDSKGKMPLSAKILTSQTGILWVVDEGAELNDEISSLTFVDVFRLPSSDRPDAILLVMQKLAEMECNEILVEAGATLAGAILEAGYWDELVLYMAPKLLGSDARALVNLPLSNMLEAKELILKDQRMVGDDIKMTYLPKSTK